MKRILVTGNAGAGKTTFSKVLAKKTGLPLHCLDSIVWKAGWVKTADLRTASTKALDAAVSCPATIGACPLEGCTTSGRLIDEGLNRMKNLPLTNEAATHITWQTVRELQRFVDASRLPLGFNTVLTPAQRVVLHNIPTGRGPLSEGSMVSA